MARTSKDASKTGTVSPGCYLWEHSPAWVPAAPGEVPLTPLTCSPATASKKTAKQSLQWGRNLPHSLKNGVRNWIKLHIPSWVSYSNVIAKASRTHFIFLALSKNKESLMKGSHNLKRLILWWLSRCLQYFFDVVRTIFLLFFLPLSLPLAFSRFLITVCNQCVALLDTLISPTCCQSFFCHLLHFDWYSRTNE